MEKANIICQLLCAKALKVKIKVTINFLEFFGTFFTIY